MSIQVEIIQREEYVEAICSGVYDLQEAVHKFPLALSGLKNSSSSRLLINYRELEGPILATQKIMYAHEITNQLRAYFGAGSADIKIAFVGKASQVSSYEPGIEVTKQNQIQAILTTDMDEAFTWLGINKT